ncbi:MAG: hypothetical protein R3F43_31030 [bacterium]
MRTALLLTAFFCLGGLTACEGDHCFDCEEAAGRDMCNGNDCFRCDLTGCYPIECVVHERVRGGVLQRRWLLRERRGAVAGVP